MSDFWEGVATTTMALVQDNWDFILWIFGIFLALFAIRGIVWAFLRTKEIFK